MTNPVSHLIMSIEHLYDEVEKLAHSERIETSSLLIFRGKHPQHGWIHIVIPTLGDGTLLFPPATQVE